VIFPLIMLEGGFGTTGSGMNCKIESYEARVNRRELIEHCCRGSVLETPEQTGIAVEGVARRG
jgi:hypothetical protein